MAVIDLSLRSVSGESTVKVVCTLLVHKSIWFQVEPHPDDLWQFAVKTCDVRVIDQILYSQGLPQLDPYERTFQTGGVVETTKGEPEDVET
jgi:hypothetical protein